MLSSNPTYRLAPYFVFVPPLFFPLQLRGLEDKLAMWLAHASDLSEFASAEKQRLTRLQRVTGAVRRKSAEDLQVCPLVVAAVVEVLLLVVLLIFVVVVVVVVVVVGGGGSSSSRRRRRE